MNSTKVGGRLAAWVANSTFGCLPLRTGGGVAWISSPSQEFSRPVGMRRSQEFSAVCMAGASRCTPRPVCAEMLIRSAQVIRTRSWDSSRSISSRRSASTRSALFIAITSARPDSITMVSTRWSCSVSGTDESISTIATSAASKAVWVRSEA